MDVKKQKWGFLRETKYMAEKAGLDKDTGLHRTGMEDYLKVIFPEIPAEEWIHDQSIKASGRRSRPDYRCETLKLIIEFDGVQHYQKPDRIRSDNENQRFYEELGYKVVRIPYFIQLSNNVVKSMFDRNIDEPLFDESIPSLGIKGKNTPAYCCPLGIKRMAREFIYYPEQYITNLKALKNENDDFLTGVSILEEEYIKAGYGKTK
ncbi:hypothetical protein HMPREF1640_08045 [Prevotella sp. S7-1-8]|uniref:DUF559 domain-containing protein n=1 Tax=Prevotella sp. S7-1-8 TaxID=1284775 RepID=UPI00050E7351|nr:DUF559 domain-containing protein [Prevotella sp. S7-1-8]KGF17040.1 hypothetical protein HMPREF1640_08045 [Prevotella sp. S7-1-8]